MEESGHYYTVYFTSLAVGFKKEIAYRQAVLAQMPDEVGWLDAANLHERYCETKAADTASMSMAPMIGGVSVDLSNNYREVDLYGTARKIPNEWRYLIETALHSLTGGSSAQQRTNTQLQLLKNRADSLEFGLLLHRLGDTYAHSVMDNETELYSVDMDSVCYNPYQIGHVRDLHDPDYPFLRQKLFFEYLTELYIILKNKADSESMLPINQMTSLIDNRRTKLSYRELEAIFKDIFAHNVRACMDANLTSEYTAAYFIRDIRIACSRNLNVQMEDYEPEKREPMSLSSFLFYHPEIAAFTSPSQLEKALNNIAANTKTR